MTEPRNEPFPWQKVAVIAVAAALVGIGVYFTDETVKELGITLLGAVAGIGMVLLKRK